MPRFARCICDMFLPPFFPAPALIPFVPAGSACAASRFSIHASRIAIKNPLGRQKPKPLPGSKTIHASTNNLARKLNYVTQLRIPQPALPPPLPLQPNTFIARLLSCNNKTPHLSMHFLPLITASAPTVSKTIHHWIYSVGGLGFILLGLLDNSIIPLPGSMDVLLILLSARPSQLWLYYGIMATIGSVIAGFVTYRIARKGGKNALEKGFSRKRLNRVYKIFERWGFWSVAIPAILPPPVPMTAFLLAAGALQYPIKKFLLALSIGRFLRYSVL